MENENFIESLKKERDEIIIEEKALNFKFKRSSKLETALTKTFNYSSIIGWILFNIGVAIWAFYYYDEFTWSRFWYHLLINIYPGFIAGVIIGGIIDPLIPSILHKIYGISKKELKVFQVKKSGLYKSRRVLDDKIAAEEKRILQEKRQKEWNEKRAKEKQGEITLLNSLRELITKLENKKLSNTEASEWVQLLSDDHRKVRAAGYQVEKSITFTNLFKKIERLQNPPAVTSPTILPVKPVVSTPTVPEKTETEQSPTLNPQYQEKARREFFRIISEAYFGFRLEWFINLLSNGQCPNRQSNLIHTLLKQEFQEYKEIGFIIQPPDYYAQKFREIYSIITGEGKSVEKEPSISIIPIENSNSIPSLTKATSSNIVTKVEDKTVTEVFGQPKVSSVIQATEKTFKVIPKQDFQVVNKKKMDIGDAGELFVYWKEKNKLFDSGSKDLSDKVQHISKESDSFGYDIISYFEDGTAVYLEVKTTIGGAKTPFEVSNAELEAMNKLENYYIVRVFDFNVNTGKGSTYTVNKTQFGTHFDLEPTSFRAKPKK